MKPYYSQDGIVIYHGDCREILPSPEPSVITADSRVIELLDELTRERHVNSELNGHLDEALEALRIEKAANAHLTTKYHQQQAKLDAAKAGIAAMKQAYREMEAAEAESGGLPTWKRGDPHRFLGRAIV